MNISQTEIMQLIASAIGGGAVLEIVKRIIGTNKVGELSQIIKTMGERIDQQDNKIKELEDRVENVTSENLSTTKILNQYKYAATFLSLCHNQDACPMKAAFDEIKEKNNDIQK